MNRHLVSVQNSIKNTFENVDCVIYELWTVIELMIYSNIFRLSMAQRNLVFDNCFDEFKRENETQFNDSTH